MGRTNGRLIPFLKESLEMKRYNNLSYEDEDQTVFYIRLPRARTEKDSDAADCERILKDWYSVNKNSKYVNYSGGKTVFQAALKKSIYLTTLPQNGTKKRFRFNTAEEEKVKKEHQKRSSSSDSNPPSVCSSGYHSGSDDVVFESLPELGDTPSEQGSERAICETGYHSGSEDFNLSESLMELNTAFKQASNMDLDIINFLENENLPVLDEATLTDMLEIMNRETNGEILSNNTEEYKSIDHNLFGVTNIVPVKDETESLKKLAVPIQQDINFQHKIWVCKKRTDVLSFVILIFESVMIESNSTGMQEQIIIPDGMLESGREYNLQKSFILLEKLFWVFI